MRSHTIAVWSSTSGECCDKLGWTYFGVSFGTRRLAQLVNPHQSNYCCADKLMLHCCTQSGDILLTSLSILHGNPRYAAHRLASVDLINSDWHRSLLIHVLVKLQSPICCCYIRCKL